MAEQNLLSQLTEQIESGDIDNTIQNLTNFIQVRAYNIFGKNRKNKINDTKTEHHANKKQWFDKKCYDTRKCFITNRNKYKIDRSDENRQAYISSRSIFNSIKRKSKQRYMKTEGIKLSNLAKSKPKQFWKTIKKQYEKKSAKSDKINNTDMFEHFKNLFGSIDTIEENLENIPFDQTIEDAELDSIKTEKELHFAIFSQNNGKSAGIDEIIIEIIKSVYDIISPLFLNYIIGYIIKVNTRKSGEKV